MDQEPTTISNAIEFASISLKYTIHSFSSYSPPYKPENIIVNSPKDSKSRWSSVSGGPNEFILVKLNNTALIKSLLFGKHLRVPHCNLREFKVYIGKDPLNLEFICTSRLQNETEYETVDLQYENVIPTSANYLKVEPVQTWGGSNFVYSIWYMEIKGCVDPEMIQQMEKIILQRKHETNVRLCLKFLRDKNLSRSFSELIEESGVKLEHPLITEFYHNIVKDFDYLKVKSLLMMAQANGLIDQAIVNQKKYFTSWSRLGHSNQISRWEIQRILSKSYNRKSANLNNNTLNNEFETESLATQLPEELTEVPFFEARDNPLDTYIKYPSPRHGHKMVISEKRNKLYLFGGFDGLKMNCEMWEFCLENLKWREINNQENMGKGSWARSGHCMILDEARNSILVLGGKKSLFFLRDALLFF
jgi:muskelin